MQLQDKFYKSTEVADILGVSLRTLYRYMETGKIQSVHLPSGRHRFTKDQIESFLFASKYMDFGADEKPMSSTSSATASTNFSTINTASEQDSNFINSGVSNFGINSNSTPSDTISTDNTVSKNSNFSSVAPESTVSLDSQKDETSDNDIDSELDALLKSLEEDTKVSQEQNQQDTTQKSSASFTAETVEEKTEKPIADSLKNKAEESVQDDLDAFLKSLEDEEANKKPESSFTSILNDNYGVQSTPEINENEIKYYYCPFNDLKSIAKMIKKIGDEHGKDYAFTMNAGLSLFFPLDLFSLIHFYVNLSDLEYFERELELKPSSKSEANVGLLLTKGDAFKESKDVSGFKVVRKERMIENLRANGLNQLASDAELRI